MNESIEILLIFISNNILYIALIILALIFKEPISSLIGRLNRFRYKSQHSEIGLDAGTNQADKGFLEKSATDEEPSSEKEVISEQEDGWFESVEKAFEEGRIDDAESIFKGHVLVASDSKENIELQKAFFLYLKFSKAKQNSAIEELKDLAASSNSESSKLTIMMWLALCFRDGMQYKKETELWKEALGTFKEESIKNEALINASLSLIKEDKAEEGKQLILGRLKSVNDDDQKSALYSALSEVEESLGNSILSVYCKDKSLEYDPNNRDELFNSAHSASNEGADDVSISNYIKLVAIDENNAAAWNNLGVQSQHAGLKIKSIQQYKRSSELNNTLAMANQGYIFLNSGFIDEAKKIAREALNQDNVHPNIHRLLSDIGEREKEQNEAWKKIKEKAFHRQKMIREYTDKFYCGDPKDLDSEWTLNGKKINVKIEKDIFKAKWTEENPAFGNISFNVELTGKISGSTFDGKYCREKSEESARTIFDKKETNECIGYFSESEGIINIFSKEFNDEFSLCLKPEKS